MYKYSKIISIHNWWEDAAVVHTGIWGKQNYEFVFKKKSQLIAFGKYNTLKYRGVSEKKMKKKKIQTPDY